MARRSRNQATGIAGHQEIHHLPRSCLMARSVYAVSDLIGIIDTALEVQDDIIDAANGAGDAMRRSIALL